MFWILVLLWNTFFIGFLILKTRARQKQREKILSNLELCKRHSDLAQKVKTREEFEFHMQQAVHYFDKSDSRLP